ncbi:MAG: hypothetical protein A3J49_01725 [Gallionellales bacterium RIFCSPHIGHO2_02_FULL_57_16]|nr:MAG: hypothetical protein A3J49_01725 [Gallionellales bacterium RIFCSPHIGHO2_02_FULL_57_16]
MMKQAMPVFFTSPLMELAAIRLSTHPQGSRCCAATMARQAGKLLLIYRKWAWCKRIAAHRRAMPQECR